MKGYLFRNAFSMGGGHAPVKGFGDDRFQVKEISRKTANDIIVNNHYSGKFYSASYIHLGVYFDGDLKGVLQFGYAMNPASQASVVADTEQDEYLELNRMWMSDDMPRNSESKAIGYAIKYIKRKYPKIKWIQSFADERCGGLGVMYQAANFDYFGEHTATFWELDGVVYHNSLMTRDPKLSKSAAFIQKHKDRAVSKEWRQFRYIFFINKRSKEKCLLDQKEYPKRENKCT
jgi:hypothetical protein